jgi:hypothetical protein
MNVEAQLAACMHAFLGLAKLRGKSWMEVEATLLLGLIVGTVFLVCESRFRPPVEALPGTFLVVLQMCKIIAAYRRNEKPTQHAISWVVGIMLCTLIITTAPWP